ncbi:peptidoglycan editing factor PgeF [Alicyclobacillaceae bacterium I2511]|nr:peptidoglycan editing factor PgeF [Alicyclobacillaceae bacterium I2511]
MTEAWGRTAAGMEMWFPSWSHLGQVRAVCFGRKGGVSEKPWDSLNVGFHVEDDPQNVTVNRQRCVEVIGGRLEDWVMAQQVHGHKVARVTSQDRGKGAYTAENAVSGVDGLVCDSPGVTLGILAADCVPVLFYDPRRGAVGIAHSGWKGTVGHLVREVVSVMKQSFGTDPSDLNVCLGPSIRECCYEVGADVARHVNTEFGSSFLVASPHEPKRPDHFMLSLQNCIRSDLMGCGIPQEKIEDFGECTVCHSDYLFSHRESLGKTGRLLSVVRLPAKR